MSRHKYPKNGRQVVKVLKRHDIEIRKASGSHRVALLPDNQVLVFHDHGEYGKGIRVKIGKALAAAGLLGILVAMFAMAII